MTDYTYSDLDAYLGTKADRPLPDGSPRHSRIERHGAEVALRYHATDVVTLAPDGALRLESNGWQTVTTKERMNRALRDAGWSLWADKGTWYLARHGNWENRYRYADGVTVYADGRTTAQKYTKEDEAAQKKLRASGVRYARAYMAAAAAGSLPAPSGGDCWYCLLGMPGGKPAEHILEHIRERYYVPSLLTRAMQELPSSIMGRQAVAELWEYGKPGPSWEVMKDRIGGTLRRYVLRHLGFEA